MQDLENEGYEFEAAEASFDLLVKKSVGLYQPWFERIALASFRQTPTRALREELGTLGRQDEESMLRLTGGVNTHRGAIWALGLLTAAAAMGAAFPEAITEKAGQLACLADRSAPDQPGSGLQAARRYQVSGARGEAQAGFPSVIVAGLPRLYRSRQLRGDETVARLDALFAIMERLEDTCLLHRGGLKALDAAQAGAASILDAGGAGTPEGAKLLQKLDRDLLALNASPGGSADMLAATLFLDLAGKA